MTQAVSLNNHF